VPAALVLLLYKKPFVNFRASVTLLVVFASISLIGTRDHLEYNRTLWEGVGFLVDRGTAVSRFSAGYVVNGWLQYAHDEDSRRDVNGFIDVPWVTRAEADVDVDYLVTSAPITGWSVMVKLPYSQWIGRSGAIYVLERAPQAMRR
jgi:hypothetical protein